LPTPELGIGDFMPQQRTAFVTGASSGIGSAIARRFLLEGYSVALFDLNLAGACKVVEEAGVTAKSLVLQGDAGEESQVKQAVNRAEAELGTIGVLVNNVGIEINGTVLDQSLEQWDRQVAVNLTSVFLFSKYCVPGMRSRGAGTIINISSVHAFASWPRCSAYDASKAGVLGITRALAVDHGPDGIRVNAICPGYIRTPLLDQWFASIVNAEQEAIRFHPLGRIGEASEIANAALFLASDQASFITGTVLTVDGGLMAAGH
jgi:NAD(P)-dependent dehydrogenase (short-subunit alcohol dehydrogenase family)